MNKSLKIKCKICDREMLSITNTHLKSHQISSKEYKNLYPEAELVSCYVKSKIIDGLNKPSIARNKYFEKLKIKKEELKTIRDHKRQQFLDSVVTLSCKICDYRSENSLQPHILSVHFLSPQQYYEQTNSTVADVYSTITRNKLGMLGDKNPWFDHKGKLSPFSEKFIKYHNETDPGKLAHEKLLAAIKSREESGNNSCTLNYYIKNGFSEQEAKEALKTRQTTFSLKNQIEKLGEEEGTKRWKKRQTDWQRTFLNKSDEELSRIYTQRSINGRGGPSKISQLLFKKLETSTCRYHLHGGEFFLKVNNKRIMIDYVDGLKAIEFFGSYYHADPRLFSENDNSPGWRTDKVSDLWRDDRQRLEIIKSVGYDIKVVWELDFIKKPEETVKECLEFLQN